MFCLIFQLRISILLHLNRYSVRSCLIDCINKYYLREQDKFYYYHTISLSVVKVHFFTFFLGFIVAIFYYFGYQRMSWVKVTFIYTSFFTKLFKTSFFSFTFLHSFILCYIIILKASFPPISSLFTFYLKLSTQVSYFFTGSSFTST